MDLNGFEWIWHNFDEFRLISTHFDTLACSKFQERVFSTLFERLRQARHLSASGGGGGGGVNITALNANSSNLPRNQNLRIAQSDPSRRDSMFQIRPILQIQSI